MPLVPSKLAGLELQLATADDFAARGEAQQCFAYLERAHILAQHATCQHVRVHWRMLRWAMRQRDVREGLGQLVRIVGAACKTPMGLVPRGNTGGANVSPFRPMPIPADLAALLAPPRSSARAWLNSAAGLDNQPRAAAIVPSTSASSASTTRQSAPAGDPMTENSVQAT